jgi:antitoxin component of MazEF toxin-antitoxin module
MKTSFKTVIQSFGNNTGIVVPPENLAELNAGKNPPVKVQVNEYEYQSTIASMGGRFLIPFAK